MLDNRDAPSLQERYAPRSICFGCGPANPQGLRIRSFPEGEGLRTDWTPEPQHQAFEGTVNGGIIGALFDCHCNWTAAWHLMNATGADHLPSTVTAEFSVRFRRPTPSNRLLTLRSRVATAEANRVRVEATLEADGAVCAVGGGTFVAVLPDHPGYHRWGD